MIGTMFTVAKEHYSFQLCYRVDFLKNELHNIIQDKLTAHDLTRYPQKEVSVERNGSLYLFSDSIKAPLK